MTESHPEIIDVLIVGGTWNPHGEGVTATFAAALDPARFAPRMVPYPADYGTHVSYAESLAAGRKALVEAIESTPNRVVLAGYSQGATIAGDVAADIGKGLFPHLDVIACALIADPLRPAGQCIDQDPGGYGIAGQRWIPYIPTYWAAAEGDPITSLPPGNALRLIADLSAYYSMSSPSAMTRWGQSLIDVALNQRFQRWWSPKNWTTWAGVLAWARGYLFDGRHTTDYVRLGHTTRLAETINREVA
ncbi:PE-PPE domain-containing protein [Nocardia huaxiensis]|uniref:Alpha/beta fold hydrolase n=1 Tax=Nocardia huaxiensis TaxID=2755382 RepID=A0A7D6ZME7_9NOCA|nr:PE-PPE domain-containing protein [Nocardia huaxiensis]QLY30843.1 alpha/beta fold hydrolase [Nocardia huaxiensis]UFS94347.1 PE-PPE domain-containing protein [Nocardia huaxiensis]